jgi:hypothetical protein
VKRLTPRWILIAGWIAFLMYAYPGYLKTDGADMLADSRVGEFTDWHSPMMTEVWRIVGRVISGPAGMLFLQSLLLLAGSYQLLRRAMSDRAAAIAAVCVLVSPPIIATTALVSAEAQLASFVIAGAAALASPQLRIRLLGLGAMFVACGMREGAALAAVPIILASFRWCDDAPRLQRLALAAAASVIVVGAACGANRVLVDFETDRNEVAHAMSDVIGTLRYAKDLGDANVQHLLAGVPLATSTEIQNHAKSVYSKPGKYAAGETRVFDPPATEAEREAVLSARYTVARAAPGAYLAHRWHVFRGILGFSKTWSPLYTEFTQNAGVREGLRHAAFHSLLQSTLIRPVHWLSGTFLFRPYLYAVLALLLLPVAVIRKERDTAVLLASGLSYELGLMFVANRAEYRDSHWMIAATVVAIILLVTRKLGRAVAVDDGAIPP